LKGQDLPATTSVVHYRLDAGRTAAPSPERPDLHRVALLRRACGRALPWWRPVQTVHFKHFPRPTNPTTSNRQSRGQQPREMVAGVRLGAIGPGQLDKYMRSGARGAGTGDVGGTATGRVPRALRLPDPGSPRAFRGARGDLRVVQPPPTCCSRAGGRHTRTSRPYGSRRHPQAAGHTGAVSSLDRADRADRGPTADAHSGRRTLAGIVTAPRREVRHDARRGLPAARYVSNPEVDASRQAANSWSRPCFALRGGMLAQPWMPGRQGFRWRSPT